MNEIMNAKPLKFPYLINVGSIAYFKMIATIIAMSEINL